MQPEISRLTAEDVPAAWRLSTQAGWNQSREDWERLLEVSPDGVIAVRLDGRLCGTASYVKYSRALAWIGMVLVDESIRGQGLGKLVFGAILERAAGADVAAIGLDATDLGRPIYRRQGFEDHCVIHRWGGVSKPGERSDGAVREFAAGDAAMQAVLDFDLRAARCDRSALLRALAGSPGVRAWCLSEPGLTGCQGFAFLRPGRLSLHLGPLVANDRTGYRRLLAAAANAADGADLIVDAIACDISSELLQSAGLEIRRTLSRMTRPATNKALADPPLRLAAGFEWG